MKRVYPIVLFGKETGYSDNGPIYLYPDQERKLIMSEVREWVDGGCSEPLQLGPLECHESLQIYWPPVSQPNMEPFTIINHKSTD